MNIVFEKTKTTPSVDFTDGYLQIQGKSIPTANFEFYHTLVDIIENYSKNPSSITVIDISLECINAYSKKCIMQIFRILERIKHEGHKIIINWFYSKEDDSMLELGTIYQSLIDIPFIFLQKE